MASSQEARTNVLHLSAVAALAGTGGALLGALATRRWLQFGSKAKVSRRPICRASWLRSAPGTGRPRVVLVATGSVASVKVPELAAMLREFADLAVVLTGPGQFMVSDSVAGRYAQSNFAAWQQLQRHGDIHVLTDADEWDGYQDVSGDAVVHVELRKWADILVVAPCSANTLAKVALGICDNLATCLLRAWDPEKPLIIAPSMNTVMWEHPTTAEHLCMLESRGCQILPPASKRLACGDVGRGALAPVAEIVSAVQEACEGVEFRRLSGSTGAGAWRRRGHEEWQPMGQPLPWQPLSA
eukprot:TRINITY_DN91270_c0_g1_i1.p1 TRINITY_DN91270_c0_g1~~TRINITY_DN91270_c0_g1_i1.p1  ORF type:complete len:315 (+),score=48.84 TRINITY_DN91270_c0_g1_i1:50-946(+)